MSLVLRVRDLRYSMCVLVLMCFNEPISEGGTKYDFHLFFFFFHLTTLLQLFRPAFYPFYLCKIQTCPPSPLFFFYPCVSSDSFQTTVSHPQCCGLSSQWSTVKQVSLTALKLWHCTHCTERYSRYAVSSDKNISDISPLHRLPSYCKWKNIRLGNFLIFIMIILPNLHFDILLVIG